MITPYAFVKVLKGAEPFLDRQDRMPKEQVKYLLGGNMNGLYLGACLDSIRWGAHASVMYEMNAKGLMKFIQAWMRQNTPGFDERFHERRIDELFEKFELPHISYEQCPRDEKHSGTIIDMEGKVRCAYVHRSVGKGRRYDLFLESFDDVSHCRRRKFNSAVVNDACYAIISDETVVLSLEKIIDRLKLHRNPVMVYCKNPKTGVIRDGCAPEIVRLMTPEQLKIYDPYLPCPGHRIEPEKIEFPFDGWALALFVQKWYEQCDNPPWFDK